MYDNTRHRVMAWAGRDCVCGVGMDNVHAGLHTRRLSSVSKTATPASTFPTVRETSMVSEIVVLLICCKTLCRGSWSSGRAYPKFPLLDAPRIVGVLSRVVIAYRSSKSEAVWVSRHFPIELFPTANPSVLFKK
jgi:hypothetical protein